MSVCACLFSLYSMRAASTAKRCESLLLDQQVDVPTKLGHAPWVLNLLYHNKMS